MSKYIDDLATELNTDPVTMGYAALITVSDYEGVKALINNKTLRTQKRDAVDAHKIIKQFDNGAYAALTDVNKQILAGLLGSSGGIKLNNKTMKMFEDIFGSTSQTVTNLDAYSDASISRAKELGFPKVRVGHIEEALA